MRSIKISLPVPVIDSKSMHIQYSGVSIKVKCSVKHQYSDRDWLCLQNSNVTKADTEIW